MFFLKVKLFKKYMRLELNMELGLITLLILTNFTMTMC